MSDECIKGQQSGVQPKAQHGLAPEAATLMLAAAFMVGGTFRIVAAFTDRFPAWLWTADF
jgi:hypothetical protein